MKVKETQSYPLLLHPSQSLKKVSTELTTLKLNLLLMQISFLQMLNSDTELIFYFRRSYRTVSRQVEPQKCTEESPDVPEAER